MTASSHGMGLLRLVPVVIAMAFLAAVSPQSVEASAIRSRQARVKISEHHTDELQTFLAGGPALWSVAHPPKIPLGVSLTTPDGQLKDNALVNYLFWKREQDPTLFDARHPRIAPLFQNFVAQTTQTQSTNIGPFSLAVPSNPASVWRVAVLTAQFLNGTDPSTPSTSPSTASAPSVGAPMRHVPNVAAQVLSVPEPPGLTLAAAMLGAALWWRRGGGRTARA